MKHRLESSQHFSFARCEIAQKKHVTRREKLLAEMGKAVPWGRPKALIEPKYPTDGRVSRQPIGVPRLLRMYHLQQWLRLADEALQDTICDSQLIREFVGIDLSHESVSDATSLLKCRRLLPDLAPQGIGPP